MGRRAKGERMIRRHKFGAVPTVVEGIRFASKKEAKRWAELKLLERAGEIVDLEHQVKYPLVVNGQLVCSYICDFRYAWKHGGGQVVEDVKSGPTKTREYRIKRKLMQAIHQVEIQEV